MTVNIRNAEARLPEHFLTKTDADAKALRAYRRGLVSGIASAWIGGLAGFVLLRLLT